jgi:hypothetical protein
MLQARPHAIHFKSILDFGEGVCPGKVDMFSTFRTEGLPPADALDQHAPTSRLG